MTSHFALLHHLVGLLVVDSAGGYIFEKPDSNILSKVGERVTLHCRSTRLDKVVWTWWPSNPDSKIELRADINNVSMQWMSRLDIPNVELKDEGIYTCIDSEHDAAVVRLTVTSGLFVCQS